MERFHSDFQKLSLREKQIASLMSEGCDALELEQRLRMNKNSISNISKKMMNKLSIDSMNEFQSFLNWVKKHIE